MLIVVESVHLYWYLEVLKIAILQIYAYHTIKYAHSQSQFLKNNMFVNRIEASFLILIFNLAVCDMCSTVYVRSN